MASVIHIAEVAAILAVAYVLGWAIGYVAHRLLARAPVVTVPAERIAAVIAPQDSDPLVKAPVIDPVPSRLPPSAPQPIAPGSVDQPAAVVAGTPAKTAEAKPILSPMAIPIVPPPPPMRVDPIAPRPKPEPIPDPEPEPVVVLTAMPSSRPGEAWTGTVRGRGASKWDAPREDVVVADEPPVEVPMTIDLGPVGPDFTYGEPIVPTPTPEPTPVPEPVAEEVLPQLEFEIEEDFVPEPRPEQQLESSEPIEDVVAEPVVATPPPPPKPVPLPSDEDAAMRAIEGGWSRVRTRAMPDSPEVSDVGAAVAAAQSAVEQVLAQAGLESKPGQVARPKGLPRPRDGIKDDLKRISGLGALDESTLNNLGVYHFDQIAGWDASQVVWMENHVFARGRIGHENWQQQARDLASVSS